VDVLPYVVALWLLVVSLYGIVTSRHLIHLIVCLTVLQSSTYVLLLAVGYREGGTSPVHEEVPADVVTVDPVVQVITLTDIVVGAVVTALLLALAVQAHKRWGTLDPDELRAMRG
jgi:multicomponent Na+:H+ antiporter subunit C